MNTHKHTFTVNTDTTRTISFLNGTTAPLKVMSGQGQKMDNSSPSRSIYSIITTEGGRENSFPSPDSLLLQIHQLDFWRNHKVWNFRGLTILCFHKKLHQLKVKEIIFCGC